MSDLQTGAKPEDLMPFAETLHLFLMQKYGLPSLTEAHMYGLVESTQVGAVASFFCVALLLLLSLCGECVVTAHERAQRTLEAVWPDDRRH